MANKISVILDLATDKAVSGLKGFKQSINDADGAVGKFKAGAGAAFDSIKQHANQLALAGGAALVAFAAKGVSAFTNLALEAGKFRDTTGATLDEASRWIAVGDDIGLSGTQISGAFNKMNVAIGAGKPLLAEYGIELKKTADGQTDANATFLHAIDTIKGIQDPTKKAELAAATFGRGWTEMSELIEQGSGTLTAAMAEVSDAQIIDDSEIAKAKKYRESMDKLKDSVSDLAVEVGEELTPAVSVAADTLAGVAPVAGDMARFVGAQLVKIADEAYAFGQTLADIADLIPGINMSEPIAETLYEQAKLERGTADLVAEYAKGAPTMEQFVKALEGQGLSQHAVNLAVIEYRKQLEGANEVTAEGSMGLEDYTEALDASTLKTDMASFAIDAKKRSDEAAKDAAKAHKESIDDQVEALTALVGGDIAVRDAQREATEAVLALTDAHIAGTPELDAAAESLINAATQAADYDEKLGNANGVVLDAQGKNDLLKQKLEELAATLAPGSALRQQIQGYIDDLNRIPTDVNTRVFVTSGATGPGQGPIRAPEFAQGGMVPGPIGAPTLAIVHGGEEVIPVNGNGGNGHAPIAITVNAGMGANGAEIGDIIVGKIREYERRNGPGWRG